jgi:hypothetical protein
MTCIYGPGLACIYGRPWPVVRGKCRLFYRFARTTGYVLTRLSKINSMFPGHRLEKQGRDFKTCSPAGKLSDNFFPVMAAICSSTSRAAIAAPTLR